MSIDKPSSACLILASASERRSSLLAEAGYHFTVLPCPIPEPSDIDQRGGGAAVAESLSFFKAERVAQIAPENAVVLGADTVVEQNGCIFGKPLDADDARHILSKLTRAPHSVITGVSLVCNKSLRRKITHDVTRIQMRPMSATELDDYIATGLWRGKAGAYGIQDHDDQFVTHIEGSRSNVVGLPMERVTDLLESWGIRPTPVAP